MKYTRDGAKINRLFTLATILIMAIVMSLYVALLDNVQNNQTNTQKIK
jgi:hypothetical protein